MIYYITEIIPCQQGCHGAYMGNLKCAIELWTCEFIISIFQYKIMQMNLNHRAWGNEVVFYKAKTKKPYSQSCKTVPIFSYLQCNGTVIPKSSLLDPLKGIHFSFFSLLLLSHYWNSRGKCSEDLMIELLERVITNISTVFTYSLTTVYKTLY